MKKFYVLLFVFALCGCGSNYDIGYEDGYEGTEKEILRGFSKAYQQGYSDGNDNAYYFDLGCEDKEHKNPPQHQEVTAYIEGYNEC